MRKTCHHAFDEEGDCIRCGADMFAPDLSGQEPCPMGCGWPTEDPYGGPCRRCWDKAPPPFLFRDERG